MNDAQQLQQPAIVEIAPTTNPVDDLLKPKPTKKRTFKPKPRAIDLMSKNNPCPPWIRACKTRGPSRARRT